MRDLIRQVVSGYKSLKLESDKEGYVLFIGQDPDTRQEVSIKILPQLLGSDPQIAARFRSLSQAIRQLNHPNIASVRKVGEESGLPYIITQAIEKAQPLADKLGQPWAVDAATDAVMQVGQALEHAYRKGIIHGSLTPEDVAVQDSGRVVVNNLGLAELQDLVGMQLKEAASPYLAPERAAGKPAGAQADVYSMAALLYSMLANRPPQVVHGEVLPPSRFNPDVPPAMDKVVVKALAPDPADRYPDVRSFSAALGAVQLAPLVTPRPEISSAPCPRCGARTQTGRFCRKCGARLEQPRPLPSAPTAPSKLDEPIQVTRVDVGHVDTGKGIELVETVIVQPLAVATGEIYGEFPEPLAMPQLDTASLWPAMNDEPPIAMPEPPPMPVIDWDEMIPPLPEIPTLEGAPEQQADE